MNKLPFFFDQKISSGLAFLLIFALGSLVAWFALAIGNDIIESAPQSKIFSPTERLK